MLKEIPNHTGYFVDETGEAVYSNKSGELKPLKTFMWGGRTKNYRTVLFVENGVSKKHKIGKLVLETFVSRRPKDNVVRHGIKGRLIDSLDNIRWGTLQDNLQDQIVQNEILKGEKNGQSKLAEYQVKLIRKFHSLDPKNGLSVHQLSRAFNISTGAIHSILNNKSWDYLIK